MERKRRLRKLIILLALLVLVGVVVYVIFNLNGKDKDKDIVVEITEKQARNVATDNLNLFEDWRGPKLVESYTLYDLDGNHSAYLFNVIDNYGKAGYITISGTTRFEPIIDLSISPDTPVTRLFNLKEKLAADTVFTPGDIRSEILYLGGDEYYVKTSYREGDEATDRYFNLSRREPINFELELSALETKYDFYLNTQEEGAKDLWQPYLN
jgi:hypothetical protein